MTRPLRSLLIGDLDDYNSEFAIGVNIAMTRAGHFHSTMGIRRDIGAIAKRVAEIHPSILWCHMLMWPPRGQGTATAPDLLELCAEWKAKGTKVLIHDGDARTDTRFPVDISPAVDLALCNHTADRSAWKIPQLHWPYFAFDQDEMADPHPDFVCDLAFAGRLSTEGIYADRTRLVLELKAKLGDRMKIFPSATIPHTLYRTPELAVSAGAILGYGRPERNGWLDVRVMQYPGAGGVLLSDDVGDLLEPWQHYIPYESRVVDSVLAGLDKILGDEILGRGRLLRLDAFEFVQAHHSATVRVREALTHVGLTL